MKIRNNVVHIAWVDWNDLTEAEKKQATESYQYMREIEEEGLFDINLNPCTMEEAMDRAKIMVTMCGLERTTYENGDTYIYVNF